ncbi:transcriptional regulator [Bacillus sp. M6-12]|uniref:helix-turn-helix domain-containing protein n=1 Tax=Bacillus sp. M6-12 TaxID=2054166 RepID=UPI000C7750A0|nr:transcriptional regulator [Bacillus sp. M6-12]PLS17618.1 transcriptional regulator [Bacillus sp. M6-12]
MLQQIGERIRVLRKQKGIGLNAFAAQLNISPAYLSNLETGKTDTIQLSVLEKLQDELSLLPVEYLHDPRNELDIRIQQSANKLKALADTNREAVEFLLANLENSLNFFQDRK